MNREEQALKILSNIVLKYGKVEHDGDLLGYTKEFHDARKLLDPKHNGQFQQKSVTDEEIRTKAREVGGKYGKASELDFGAGAEWMREKLK